MKHQVAGQSNINSQDIREMPVALAPLKEQKRIVEKIEDAFRFAERIETSIIATKKSSDLLDRAILDKAFRGELVPQDPNEEPASILLQSIESSKNRWPPE